MTIRIGTFARPPFTAPVLPSPPAVFSVTPAITAIVKPLAAVAGKVQSVAVNPFGTVNVTLAQLKTQAQGALQSTLKRKANAVAIPPSMPSGLIVNPSAIAQYAAATKGILNQSKSTVDEFKKAKPGA
jgi:hypothetical protein